MDIEREDLFRLRKIGRDSIFQPFEGKKNLEALKKTRTGLEKGVSWLGDSTRKTGSWLGDATKKTGTWLGKASKTTGEWIANSKVGEYFKIQDESDGESKKSLPAKSEADSKEPGKISRLLKKWDEATADLQASIKEGYKTAEEKIRVATAAYAKKTCEALLYEDSEKWILKRAPDILGKPDLNSIERVRELSPEDREWLIDVLYPYDSPSLDKYSKVLDITINVALGTVVATNIPMTGVAVGLANMAKTIIKIANRITILSSIHGRKISSADALFKVSASLIESMEDWESNPDHRPPPLEVFERLYGLESEEESGFKALMNATVKKDAYITVPGVGMIGLGKITLDDYKMDLMVKSLLTDFFAKKELEEKLGLREINLVIADFRQIFSEFSKANYFSVKRAQWEEKLKGEMEEMKKREVDSKEFKKIEGDWIERLKEFSGEAWNAAGKSIKEKWKDLSSGDYVLEKISSDLDLSAYRIFKRIQDMSPEEKIGFIRAEVEKIMADV